jgi:hypothetical protein
MKSRHGRSMLPWLVGALALTVLLLTGCVEVQVVDTTPAAEVPDTFTSPLAAGEGERNMAVLAVDFDPPLSYQQLILRRQAVELLVAVENSGGATERNVTVQAQLSSPEDPAFVLAQEASLPTIASGEIQVVRFAPLKEIPYHQIYRLEVWIDPLPGESDLADNQKAFDIQVHQQ